jgi:hypothetical protein
MQGGQLVCPPFLLSIAPLSFGYEPVIYNFCQGWLPGSTKYHHPIGNKSMPTQSFQLYSSSY